MKNKKTRSYAIGIVLLALLVPTLCFALGAESDPRDTFPCPGGTKAFVLYYRGVNGGKYNVNGNTVNNNTDMNASLVSWRYVQYWAPTEKITIQANLIMPVGYQHLQMGSLDQSSSGLGDLQLVAGGFYTWVRKPDFSLNNLISFYVIAPTGEYDHNKSVNLGTNAWDFRVNFTPVSLRWKKITWEEIIGLDWYTNNNDYGAASATLQRNSVFTSQSALSIDITKNFWIGASYYYHGGGGTQINGVDQNNSITEHKVMSTLGFNTSANTQLLLQYAKDISLDNGVPTSEVHFRFAWML